MKKKKDIKIIKRIVVFLILIVVLILLRKPLGFMYNEIKFGISNVNNSLVNFKSKIYKDYTSFNDKINIISNSDMYISKIKEKDIKYQELELKLNDYENIKKDNEDLRTLLNLKENINIQTIPASVKLVEEINNDYLYIDKGIKDQIKKGQVVLYNGKMIGIIHEVFDEYSKVLLLVSKDSKVSVTINGIDYGILRGNGNNTFSIKNYNRDLSENLEYFDIESSGVSSFIPKGIKIGTFRVEDKKILKEDKELIFTPDYEYLNINYVLVVKELKK